MNLLFTIVYGIWLASEVLLNRLVHSSKKDKQNADKNTLAFIWLTVLISAVVASYISMNVDCPIGSITTVPYIGLLLIGLGIVLRFLVIQSLGHMFTVDVTIREGHQLKKDGIYKYLRHPSYSASYLSFIGFGLSLNNWISLAIIAVAMFIAFLRRIRVEEAVLIQQFGEEYISYSKHTKRLIPFVY